MYCTYLIGECFYPNNCFECNYYKKYWQGVTPIPQQYNYKCSCGGEFFQPIYKWISIEVKEIGTGGIVANAGQGYYSYACPFCGKPMEGMN